MDPDKRVLDYKPGSPASSCVSMKSDNSMHEPFKFSSGTPHDRSLVYSTEHTDPSRVTRQKRTASPVPSNVPLKTVCVEGGATEFSGVASSSGQGCSKAGFFVRSGTQEDTLCQQDHTGPAPQRRTLVGTTGDVDPEQSFQNSGSNTSILLDHSKKHADYNMRRVQMNHKTKLEFMFKNIFEGMGKQGNPTLLNRIYTWLYITEGQREGVNDEHEVWHIESASRVQTSLDTPINCNDIFKCLPGQEKIIRIVLTKGVAGIGKTVSVQKFILDWAEGKANQDIDFIFVLPFREINLIKDEQYSLVGLLLEFHPELKGTEINIFNDCKVLFIFDGLDESRLPLKFKQNEMLTDITKSSSVDELLTNLFNGNLLPSALVWVTTRPAAASQIPPECVDQVTEIRGFSDPQKEEYFHKRLSNKDLASRIISHIKSSRSLYIMCHIPVFCWLSATVLEEMLGDDCREEIPTTLTQMYSHFLLVQTNIKNKKYHGTNETNTRNVSQSDRDLILRLGELALQQLERGNIIFYEDDLRECGIDVSEASVCSGVCTQIFKEEFVMYQKKVYCFVHLSIQEFLAALYVYQSYASKKLDSVKILHWNYFRTALFELCKAAVDKALKSKNGQLDRVQQLINVCFKDYFSEMSLFQLHKAAVDEALQSKNGHLDLFLRFFLGLSLDSNKSFLQGILMPTESSSESIKNTVQYITELQSDNHSPERFINLLLCLVEMNDFSILKKVQQYQENPSGRSLTPAECSCLAYVILMSGEILDVFDANRYNTSPEGRTRLLPAVKCCRKAVFMDCKMTESSCGSVASALHSANSHLTELDLSYSHLEDSGVKELCAGLMSPHCKLHTLRVTGCKMTESSCGSVASALQSVNSHLTELDLSYNHLEDSGVKELCAGLMSPHCKLHTLRLTSCKMTESSCGSVASALQSVNSHLIELDLSYNHLENSGVKELCAGLMSPHCKLHTLRLTGCKMRESSCGSVALALQSVNSHLIELDLSYNHLEDSGVKELCAGLMSPHCKLHTLRLTGCKMTELSCGSVALALQSVNSYLTELDLSYSHLEDSGVKELCARLMSPHCKLHTLRVKQCNLTEGCCEDLASVLKCHQLKLIELDLSVNDLLDRGVTLLSAGLENPNCKLQTLRLSLCRVTERGCSSLASALGSNPSHLRELDLSYNHPGDSGVKLLSALLEDPHCKLDTLRVDHGGPCRVIPGPRMYSCQLTLDPNTANTHLYLSKDNRTVTRSKELQPYPDHPDRFDSFEQVLCAESLTGCCYWEVQWGGDEAVIGVTYKGIGRKGFSANCRFGHSDKSWVVCCSDRSYYGRHNNAVTKIPAPSSRRVALYLDWTAGTLSFYSVSSGELSLLHRFASTFTEPLYAGFRVYYIGSSVSLCEPE